MLDRATWSHDQAFEHVPASYFPLAKFAMGDIFLLMSTMNISLPEELRAFVNSQVSEGAYTSSSEYVRDVLRKEQDRVRLREMLLEGAASPVSENVWNAEYFEKMRQRVRAKKK